MNDFPVIGDLVLRTGLWDRQRANIASCYKLKDCMAWSCFSVKSSVLWTQNAAYCRDFVRVRSIGKSNRTRCHFVGMTTLMSLKPYDTFSSISNKTMVAMFPNVCLWRRSYAQNWKILTLKNCYCIEPPSYASTAYVVASFGLVSFLLFRKNLGNL